MAGVAGVPGKRCDHINLIVLRAFQLTRRIHVKLCPLYEYTWYWLVYGVSWSRNGTGERLGSTPPTYEVSSAYYLYSLVDFPALVVR